MKVLVLAQYFPPDMGGGSTRASNVVKGLLSKGCDVTVVAAFPHYPHGKVPKHYKSKAIVSERFGNAKVYRVWIPALAHSSSVKRIVLHMCFVFSSLFALLFVDKVDVVWGANPNLFSFFPSFVYGVVKRVPIVRNVDDLWPEVFYELGYVKSKIARKLLDICAWFSYVVPDAITPISSGYQRFIISKYGISPTKIVVIMVGIDSAKSLGPLTKEIDTGQCTVMYSGVLGFGYNFDIMLEAAKILDENRRIRFIIRGIGELDAVLKRQISKLKLSNFTLYTDFLPVNELNPLMQSVDVFVLPMADSNFVNLGMPTKLFEYQSYSKPIICVSDGEPARYVEATRSGLIVHPNNPRDFAEKVLELCDNSQRAAELGRNGQSYVSQHLTCELIGDSMLQVFTSLQS